MTEFNIEQDRRAEAIELSEIDLNSRTGEAMRAHDATMLSLKEQAYRLTDKKEQT